MSLKQALLSNYYKRKSGNVNESESSSDDESVYLPSKSKSMYDQPMSWTRVKNIKLAVNQRVTIFDIERDL